MDLFKLEFSVEQQAFHLEPIKQELSVDVSVGDWITICETCTPIEADFAIQYIENKKLNLLTRTNVQHYFDEAKSFFISLFKNGIVVSYDK